MNRFPCNLLLATFVVVAQFPVSADPANQPVDNSPETSNLAAYKEALQRANDSIQRQNEVIRRLNEEMRQRAEQIAELQAKLKSLGLADSNQPSNRAVKFVPDDSGKYPMPPYPAAAMKQKLSGNVTVEISVNSNGSPEKVVVSQSSGVASLDANTIDWVKSNWHWPGGTNRNYYWTCLYKLQ